MKTLEMKMNALQDAKEAKFNIEQNLLLLKQEMGVLGAQLPDTVIENMMKRICELERQYTNTCLLISHYEKELGK